MHRAQPSEGEVLEKLTGVEGDGRAWLSKTMFGTLEKELLHMIKHNPHACSQILASVEVFSFPYAGRRLESSF